MIVPETDIERKILSHAVIQAGLAWGKPRPGHPEGTVQAHVEEILTKIDGLRATQQDREKLRIIAILHDTFKFHTAKGADRPAPGELNHGQLAAAYARDILGLDARLCAAIELHDKPRSFYLSSDRRPPARTKQRILDLVNQVDIHLFLAFIRLDGSTGNKEIEPLVWFESRLLEYGVL